MRDGDETDPLEERGAREIVGDVTRGADERGAESLGIEDRGAEPLGEDGRLRRGEDEEEVRELTEGELSYRWR